MNHSLQAASPHEANLRLLKGERRIEGKKLLQLKLRLQANAKPGGGPPPTRDDSSTLQTDKTHECHGWRARSEADLQ